MTRDIFKKANQTNKNVLLKCGLRFNIEYTMRDEGYVCGWTWKTLRGSFNLKYALQTDRAEQGVVKSQRVLDFILSRLG